MEEKARAQRGQVISPGRLSWEVVEPGSEPGAPDPKLTYILDHSPLSFRGERGSRVEGGRTDKITKRNRQAELAGGLNTTTHPLDLTDFDRILPPT